MDAKSFGVFLAQQRKKQGFTQAELAEQLHVTKEWFCDGKLFKSRK